MTYVPVATPIGPATPVNTEAEAPLPPPTAPSYVPTAAPGVHHSTTTPPQPIPYATATTIPSPPPRTSTTYTTSTTIPASQNTNVRPSPSVVRTSNPPPGIADGGAWRTVKHHGPTTWATCGVLSAIGCVLLLFPIGVFALCCPCDEREVYVVNSGVYNRQGKFLGRANRFRFKR